MGLDGFRLQLNIESKLGSVKMGTQFKSGEFFAIGHQKIGMPNMNVYYVIRTKDSPERSSNQFTERLKRRC